MYMKTLKVSLLIFCVMTVFSCSQDGESISPNPPSDVLTDVSVTFSGFEVTVTPDARDDSNTRATANEANVTRIALKILTRKVKPSFLPIESRGLMITLTPLTANSQRVVIRLWRWLIGQVVPNLLMPIYSPLLLLPSQKSIYQRCFFQRS